MKLTTITLLLTAANWYLRSRTPNSEELSQTRNHVANDTVISTLNSELVILWRASDPLGTYICISSPETSAVVFIHRPNSWFILFFELLKRFPVTYVYICVGCTFELLDLLPQTRRLIYASLEEQPILQKVQQKNCFKKLCPRYLFNREFEARWHRWHAVSREFEAQWKTRHSADKMMADEITWVFHLHSMMKWSHSQCCL